MANATLDITLPSYAVVTVTIRFLSSDSGHRHPLVLPEIFLQAQAIMLQNVLFTNIRSTMGGLWRGSMGEVNRNQVYSMDY